MEWGRRLEDAVAQKYADDNGVELQKVDFMTRDGWMGATPDRLIVGKKKGLEIKTAGFRTAKLFGEAGSDQIPETYLCQCAWYLAVADLDEWDLAVLINGSDYRVFNIQRSARLENRLIEIATQFRERHILAQVPPPIDGSKAAENYLRAIFPRQKGEELIPATQEISDLATALSAAKMTLAQYEAEVSEIENKIKAAIGDAPGIQGETWKATWKAGKDTTKVDYKAIVADLKAPKDLVEKHTVIAPASRRFLFTVNKQ
jgi:predicted phage-related endonuclease